MRLSKLGTCTFDTTKNPSDHRAHTSPMEESILTFPSAILESDFNAFLAIKGGHIVWANKAMHRLFGYEIDELIGQPTHILFTDQSSDVSFADEIEAIPIQAKAYTKTDLAPEKRTP